VRRRILFADLGLLICFEHVGGGGVEDEGEEGKALPRVTGNTSCISEQEKTTAPPGGGAVGG